MNPPTPLLVYDAFGLARDYDARIDAIWNIYILGISAILTAVNVKSWRPRWWLLTSAFGMFSIGNLWALSRYYAAHTALMNYARGLSPPSDLVEALTLPPLWQLTAFHVIIDLLVVVAIILFCKRPPEASQEI